MFTALAASTRYEQLGSHTAPTSINQQTGSKPAYTAIGTTSFDYDAFWLFILATTTTTAYYRVDVGVNTGGSDQTLVADWYFRFPGAGNIGPAPAFFPIRVPKGATLKGRAQSSTSAALAMVILGVHGDSRLLQGYSRAINCTDWAAGSVDPANSFTFSGTSTTAWQEITSSLTQRISGLYVSLDERGNTSGFAGQFNFEIGVGSAGSERALFHQARCNNQGVLTSGVGPFPVDLASGARLVGRATPKQSQTLTWSLTCMGLVA
jgi:hypothetical protein